tara:strand:- start:1116 stop:1307 length:192 start_codon:yes stop_codon:yes gene_type:complete
MSKPQIFVLVKSISDGWGGCDQIVAESFLYEEDAVERVSALKLLKGHSDGDIYYEIEEVDFTE